MKSKLSFKYLFCFCAAMMLTGICLVGKIAAEEAATGDKYFTKGEAIELLSASELIKKKIGELFSWTSGYDVSKISKVNLTPVINYIKVLPRRIPPDGKTTFELQASVDDPGGIKNIAGVRADLSPIGSLPDAALFSSIQGVFSLEASVSTKVGLGQKDISISVINKRGWLALAKTSLEVKINPAIVDSSVMPEKALANGKTLVTITVQIDNPGKIEDVREVSANLKALGMLDKVSFKNDGEAGDLLANDNTWTLQFVVSEQVQQGEYLLPLRVSNVVGGVGTGKAILSVYK